MVGSRALPLLVQLATLQFSLSFRQLVTGKLFLPHHLLGGIDLCKLQLSLTLDLLLDLQLGLSLSFFLLVAPLNLIQLRLLLLSHFLESFELQLGILNLHLLDSFGFFFGLFKKHLSFLFFFLHLLLSLLFKPLFLLLKPFELL